MFCISFYLLLTRNMYFWCSGIYHEINHVILLWKGRHFDILKEESMQFKTRHSVALTMMNVSVGKGINWMVSLLWGLVQEFLPLKLTRENYFSLALNVCYISLINEVFNYFSSARKLFLFFKLLSEDFNDVPSLQFSRLEKKTQILYEYDESSAILDLFFYFT